MLLSAMMIVAVFSISLLMARHLWEREIGRDMEEELIYRARHIVAGVQRYYHRHQKYPQGLEVLEKEKYIRRLYKDPISTTGEWNYVMTTRRGGKSRKLIVVPPSLLSEYITNYQLIGVCSGAVDESFREYRGVKYYYKWAFYAGEDVDTDMPELTYVSTL